MNKFWVIVMTVKEVIAVVIIFASSVGFCLFHANIS